MQTTLLNTNQSNWQPQKPLSKHDPNDPQRRSPQRIRVLASGRLLVDRPEADQRVELVSERDRDRHRIGRHAVGRAERLVVLLDGGCDRRLLALASA